MLLQIPPFNTPIKHLSQADSLKIAMHNMQAKMDSLERIVMKTEIGTGYFTGIIALQLGVFLFLVSLGGFLGWRWFHNQINKTQLDCKKHAEDLIKTLSQKYDDNLDSLQYDLRKTIYDASRGMYFVADRENVTANMFTWSLSCARSQYILNPNNFKTIKIWLDEAKRKINLIEPGNSDIKINTELQIDLNTIHDIENEEIKILINEIRADLNHVIYTKPQPPENIMEDDPQDVVFEDPYEINPAKNSTP